MTDAYRHNSDGVSTTIVTLTNLLKQYNDKILELKSLIEKINSSSSWKDMQVKTSFISTCNSYIQTYTTLADSMEKYIKYLNGKSSGADELENAFMR